MTWTYRGLPLTSIEDIPVPKAIGFIYLITQISTGKRYIGKKLLTKAGTKTTAGKKKKIRLESDWKTYWSSSPKLKDLIDEIGTQDFLREILQFVSSKSELLYAEEYALYYTNALLSDEWFNDNIRSRVMRAWFTKNSAEFKTNINKLSDRISNL